MTDENDLWQQYIKGVKKRNHSSTIEDDLKPRIRIKRAEPNIVYESKSMPTIDLHGMTLDIAYNVLVEFINNAQKRGVKCVLVITGKGKSVENDAPWNAHLPGTIKTEVPKWLSNQELKNKIKKYTVAKPNHGGDGAIYIYLSVN